MAVRSRGKQAVAARAWQLLFDFFVATRSARDRTLERRKLTSNDSRALMSLDADVGKTMGTLAREWCCDASNATWVVDRLERLGFAERRPSPTDRRAKLVLLTTTGAKAKSDILAEFRTPPPAFLALGRDDLEALITILQKVPHPSSTEIERVRQVSSSAVTHAGSAGARTPTPAPRADRRHASGRARR